MIYAASLVFALVVREPLEAVARKDPVAHINYRADDRECCPRCTMLTA